MWLFPAFQLQPKQHLYQLSKHKSVKPWCVYLHAKKESINVNVCIHVSLDGPPPTETCQVNIWRVGVLGGGGVKCPVSREGTCHLKLSIHSTQASDMDRDT